MDINQLSEILTQQPQFQQVLQGVAEEFSDVSPEQVDELIKLIEFALQRPQQYDEILAAAIRDDMIDPGDLPEQFDAQTLLAVLVVLKRLRQSAESGEGAQLAMRRGGLTRVRSLAARGRFGDTMLAHITPREAEILRARGGAGTINPETGLPEFFLKKLIKAVLPIALNFIAPGLGSVIGGAILGAGASAAAMSIVGGMVLGGITSGITGGNVLQGIVMGGLGGGLGGSVGGTVSDALKLNLGATGQSILGGALIGGATGAATGQGFGKGALMGAAGAGFGAMTQGVGSGQLGAAIGTAGTTAGNMLTAGYKPKEALAGGALSGLIRGVIPEKGLTQRFSDTAGKEGLAGGTGLSAKPSDIVVEGLKVPTTGSPGEFSQPGTVNYLTGEQGIIPGTPPQLVGAETPVLGVEPSMAGQGLQANASSLYTPQPASSGILPNLSMKNLGALAMVGSALSKPPAVQQAVQGLSPQQQEYFNRPGIKWDWAKLQADANARNMSLSEFMASYWPQITSGNYVLPGSYVPPGQNTMPTTPTANMAAGGPVSVGSLVRSGIGSILAGRKPEERVETQPQHVPPQAEYRGVDFGSDYASRPGKPFPFKTLLDVLTGQAEKNRPPPPGPQWDWSKIQAAANAKNMSLGEFMAVYGSQLMDPRFLVTPAMGQNAMPDMPTTNMAAGGLNSMARLMRGGGSGRDDTISAKLSDGEYVMDAETVAMLGDGSTAAGAKKLDQMRAQLRKHKGKVMARGKFSPDAKSPLAYLKGA